MNKSQQARRQATLKVFMEQTTNPDITEPNMLLIIDRLRRHNTTKNRFNDILCSDPKGLTDRQKTRLKNIEKEVKETCEFLGFKVEFDGDPRGNDIKIYLPDKHQYNDLSGAWCMDW